MIRQSVKSKIYFLCSYYSKNGEKEHRGKESKKHAYSSVGKIDTRASVWNSPHDFTGAELFPA
jgi:hypothetical protein